MQWTAWRFAKSDVRDRIRTELERGASARRTAAEAFAAHSDSAFEFAMHQAANYRANAVALMPEYLQTLARKPLLIPLSDQEKRDQALFKEAVEEFNRPTPEPSNAPVVSAAFPLPKFVVVQQSIAVPLKYGTANIPRGATLPLISRGPVLAKVQYGSETVDLPISITDLK